MICVQNSSKGNSYRESKRVIASVIPKAAIRLNIGDVPKRVLLKLIRDLRKAATKNTEIKIYFPDKGAFRGVKCVEIGRSDAQVSVFKNSASKLDSDLKEIGIK